LPAVLLFNPVLHRAKLVMEEASLLMKINKNKNTANAMAKEKMIEDFLSKVSPRRSKCSLSYTVNYLSRGGILYQSVH
jgi:hypothetical protein